MPCDAKQRPVPLGGLGAWVCRAGALVGLVLACLLGGGVVAAQSSQAAPQWGQKLLQTLELPQAELDRWMAGAPVALTAPAQGGAAAQPPGPQAWRGPMVNLGTEGSPYTIVIKATGQALADGQASLNLRVGWLFDGSNHPLMLPTMKQPTAHAGQALELTGVSIPVTMKQDREAALVIESGDTANLQVARVQVEIWSGMGNVSMGNSALSWLPLLLGLCFVAFMVWLRRQ